MTEVKRGRAAPVVPAGPNLVTSWREIATHDGRRTLTEALGELNTALGTNTRVDRVAAWEQGERKPDYGVVNYMLRVVLTARLQQQGLSDEVIRTVVDSVQIAVK